jgi:transcriptional regulator with XRE-family HTH domain
MTENERFKEVLNYLIRGKKIRNQQEFTEKVGSNKTTISQIKNGEIKIPNNLFEKITHAFPFISFDWLLTGEGEMLKQECQEQKNDPTNENFLKFLHEENKELNKKIWELEAENEQLRKRLKTV